MTISAAVYRYVDSYPVLDMQVDGRPVRISPDAKRSLLALGYVFLGAAFEDTEHTVHLPETEEHVDLVLRGVTDDPAVAAIVRRFIAHVDAGTFEEGPASPQ